MKVINLLPKNRRQELHYMAVLHSLWIVFLLSLVSFGLVILGQFATKFYLKNAAEQLKLGIVDLKEQIKQNDSAEVKAQVKAANDLVLDYKNLAESPKWSKVIKAFVKLPPSRVKINNFAIDPTQKSIRITGFSPTRELVIELYNNILNDSDNFYNIDYPLENVAKPTDINFHFTFNIKEDLLK